MLHEDNSTHRKLRGEESLLPCNCHKAVSALEAGNHFQGPGRSAGCLHMDQPRNGEGPTSAASTAGACCWGVQTRGGGEMGRETSLPLALSLC